MSSRIPLNTVTVFSIAAKCMSFSQAAEVLNVTPGAVSRMVKKLEEYLQVRLFHRTSQGLELTSKGKQFLGEISDPLAAIAQATDRMRKTRSDHQIRVSCHPTFAARWLLPRWSDFHEMHPDIDVQVITTLSTVDFDLETDVDIAIQLDGGPHDTTVRMPQVQSDHLLDIEIIAVCSPNIIPTKMTEMQAVQFLSNQVLIHVAALAHEWRNWLEAYSSASLNSQVIDGLKRVKEDQGPEFQTLDLAIKAAIEGVGIAVVFKEFVQNDLSSGRLINPLPFTRHSQRAFYIQSLSTNKHRSNVQKYRNWLLGEAGK